MRIQVGIIGAGPAGLLLSHVLNLEGIGSVVLEARSRDYVESRIRAGVLEQGTVDLLTQSGLGARMAQIGLLHRGIELRFRGERHRIDFPSLTEGKSVMVYAQHEVVKDLIAARLAAGGDLRFEAKVDGLDGIDTAAPSIRYTQHGAAKILDCQVVVACDGFHGIGRTAIPSERLRVYERVYPFGWLGILAEAPPSSDELIYARHDEGFALFSMRSPTVSRLYLQCPADVDLGDWPDARIWDELERRAEIPGGWPLARGPVLQKGVTPVRSFVAEPMQHGRLFLAGDAAHIVPPTGAKGLNLAAADVRTLSRALVRWFRTGNEDLLEAYSATALRRVWQAERFSWWMTSLLHRFDETGPFGQRIQLAELDYVTSSQAAMRTLAENYVGLPFAD
ncbi:p-hydroxybenzoate 3-monooxygenase [Tepidamorphus gemmatus]|uniref:p-hydroxybenzoate 3-monooxygenase n=1 Tax=Tepidamorphus gemmatus TaxID=747076 RepID=A0A4R3MAJ3_9HYPH|nr:4-hydroxybenzoate 3-monooxygenase [Tepidamorphus gemmatus]TCT10614.1 p-hydroxybenzoate 3-monooxygenase [Tepidamorphus gemmatus]